MKIGGEIMLAVRQKKITEKIIQNGFNLNDFDFKPISNDEFSIYFRPNNTFFMRQTGKKSMKLKQINVYTMRPYVNGEIKFEFDFDTFDNLIQRFEIWLSALRENVDIGNPWDIFKSSDWFSAQNEFDNYEELFTHDDQLKTHLKLDLLLDRVQQLGIDDKNIVNDIAYLKEATNRLSKKDWFLLFSGVFLSWGLSAIMSKENVQTLIEYAGNLISSIKSLN